ncbi:DsrE family protein [Verrucomicrobiaceae bacterium N1E253]|uniref:DsrE family protein n=1 Tax=Oceaniferula marina TaxID=2748318 RepID=A0A851GI28_9BACT|nr:DsrE family protein [Oceaniferula marina]NWK57438.1 DsrE family protein [Oceaniferula marina]
MQRSVIITRNGMGEGDPKLSLILLEKYLTSSLENDDIKDVYAFYNSGVKAPLENKNIYLLLEQVQSKGAEIYFCGTCLEFYGLAQDVNIGKIACMNDIRTVINNSRADFL